MLHSFLLKVLPATKLKHYDDFYLNVVHFFDIPEPHLSLTVEATSIVSTVDYSLPLGIETARMEALRRCLREEGCYDFLGSSLYVEVTADAWRLALDVCSGLDDVWASAVAIMQFIHSNFSYSAGITTVNTRMEEVLEHRAGVCQDFAHVMIGLCRAVKIPARYVSGYLFNGPTETLVGAQASHAWCEVYIPGIGWRGLDPTNNCQADEHYVKVAIGRDYGDVVPIKGYFSGSPEVSLSVDVIVTKVGD